MKKLRNSHKKFGRIILTYKFQIFYHLLIIVKDRIRQWFDKLSKVIY